MLIVPEFTPPRPHHANIYLTTLGGVIAIEIGKGDTGAVLDTITCGTKKGRP
ncbi:MAG TPA: hypothetical protein VGJ20_24900 [Xanthobacteraceae bacterium]